MPLVGCSTAGENKLKLSANVPADPVVTVSVPLCPEEEELPPLLPPLLPPQPARTPAVTNAVAAKAADRIFQCLVIVDTLFRCRHSRRWHEAGRPVLVP